jgi:integrase
VVAPGAMAQDVRSPMQRRAWQKTKYPGVFWRAGRSGERLYSICFRNSEGKQQWERIDGGVMEAQAVLADRKSAMAKGQRVAKSSRTFTEVAEDWKAIALPKLKPRTAAIYEVGIRVHLAPRIGHLRIGEITTDHVAKVIAEMEASGKAASTIRNALAPLNRIFKWAVRRGLIPSNPMADLDSSERPKDADRPIRVLSREEIGRLLDAAEERYWLLLATALFSGLRLGELLGLRWKDIDFGAEVIRVRTRLDRQGEHVALKQPKSARDVVLMPSLAKRLKAHRLASLYSLDEDLVFPSDKGTGLDHRNVRNRAFYRAVARAGLNRPGERTLTFHDLRHVFASILIAEGNNVVYVSRQMGHAKPSITLNVYAHLFEAEEHARKTREGLEQRYGALL